MERTRLSLLLTALTALFLLQAQRVFLPVLFALGRNALASEPRPAALAGAALAASALLVPLVPFSRWIDRRHLLVAAAMAAALARVGLFHSELAVRASAAGLLTAGAAVYLVTAVGQLQARSVAAGVAAAVVLDQLLLIAGRGEDPTLRSTWLPVTVATGAAMVALAVAWLRWPDPEPEPAELERRASGLRLRGAIALGVILFFQTSVLGLPAIGARWMGPSFVVLSVLLVGAAAAATALLAAADGMLGRHWPAAAILAGLATAAVVVPGTATGWGPAMLIVMGQCAALLLLGRALAPASGRRGGWTMVAGLLTFTALHALYAGATPATGATTPWPTLWIFTAAGALLTAVLVLSPRPHPVPPVAGTRPTLFMAGSAVVVAAWLAGLGDRSCPPEENRYSKEGLLPAVVVATTPPIRPKPGRPAANVSRLSGPQRS